MDSLFGLRHFSGEAASTPSRLNSHASGTPPLPITRRRVAAAVESLAGEALALADAVELGRVPLSDLVAVCALVAEARAALGEFRRE
jgi:hypothetical protein